MSTLSMQKGETLEVNVALADKLINDGIAKEFNATEPSGKITITENGDNINVAQYATADVNVPNPSTGTVYITQNGTTDVSAYAEAEVSIFPTVAQVNLVNNTGVSMNVFGYFNEYGQSMVWGAMKTTVYVLPNTQGLFTPVCVFAFNGSVTGTLVATGVDNEGRTVHCVAGRTGNSGVVGITDGAGVKAPVTITLTLE